MGPLNDNTRLSAPLNLAHPAQEFGIGALVVVATIWRSNIIRRRGDDHVDGVLGQTSEHFQTIANDDALSTVSVRAFGDVRDA